MNTNKKNILPILNQAEEVYRRVNDTPHGQTYVDADVILSDCIENAETESGLFEDICRIYRKCSDCDSFEALFEALTGCDFEEYLKSTIKGTTLLGPDTDNESGEVLPFGNDSEEASEFPSMWYMPGNVTWVVGEVKPSISGDADDVVLQVCPAVIREVVLTQDDEGYPTSYMNADVYPNCEDDEDLENKFHFRLTRIPIEECYPDKESAYDSIEDEDCDEDGEENGSEEAEERAITSFTGIYAFLSNAYPCKVTFNGVTYQCAEAAFQAQKNPDFIPAFVSLNADQAKTIGKSIPIQDADWDTHRTGIMYRVIMEKFLKNPELAQKLLDTDDVMIVQENNSGETFWGVCDGEGENHMGEILMSVRSELRKHI